MIQLYLEIHFLCHLITLTRLVTSRTLCETIKSGLNIKFNVNCMRCNRHELTKIKSIVVRHISNDLVAVEQFYKHEVFFRNFSGHFYSVEIFSASQDELH